MVIADRAKPQLLRSDASHAIPTNPFEIDTIIHSPIAISTDVINRNSYEELRLID